MEKGKATIVYSDWETRRNYNKGEIMRAILCYHCDQEITALDADGIKLWYHNLDGLMSRECAPTYAEPTELYNDKNIAY